MFVFNDNQAAIAILGHRSNGTMSKHFSPRLCYVTKLVEKGLIKLYHIPRGQNGADILTHLLGRVEYETELTIIYGGNNLQGLIDIASSNSGGEMNFHDVYSNLQVVLLPHPTWS